MKFLHILLESGQSAILSGKKAQFMAIARIKFRGERWKPLPIIRCSPY